MPIYIHKYPYPYLTSKTDYRCGCIYINNNRFVHGCMNIHIQVDIFHPYFGVHSYKLSHSFGDP